MQSVVSFSTPLGSNDNLAKSSNLKELLACVPRTFHPFYQDVLKEWFELGTKISHCQHAITQLDNHKRAHTFPPSINGALKGAVVQVSKEFKESSAWTAWSQQQQTKIASIKATELDDCIAVKTAEARYLETLVSEERSIPLNNSLIERAKSAFQTQFGSPDSDSPLFREEVTVCATRGVTWLQRAKALGITKHQQEIITRLSKLDLRKDTDVHMSNYGTNDIRSIVDRAVAEALAKPRDPTPRKPATPKKGTYSTVAQCGIDTNVHRSETHVQTERSHEGGAKTSTLTRSRKRKWEWRRETQEILTQIDHQASRRTKPVKAHETFSLPPRWFHQDVEIRAQWLLLHSTDDYINSISSTQSDVFQGPDVSIPSDIRQMLSFNGKFLLHDKMRPQLVLQAWHGLCRSVRIKYAFRTRRDNAAFIPKFYIPQPDWVPPHASEQIEEGLRKIKKYCYQQINLLPRMHPPTNPNLKRLEGFLTETKSLVKITDKNLGLSVVSIAWYQEQCRVHLSNAVAYREHEIRMEGLRRNLEEICSSTHLPSQVRKYLRASTSMLPRFYVIPKVHKTPWSSRPIIPSHSWITSKVAEVVDYALQPMIELYPSILNSSKELVARLSKIDSVEGCWFITGDVTAMYTNIDPAAAERILRDMVGYSSNRIRKSDLMKMIDFVLLNNFFRYEDRTYWQSTGLAMGVACAPVIANLYCAKFEKDMMKYRNSKLKFYGRYIDDCLAILQGTETDVKNWIAKWKLPGLNIVWEYSRTRAVFLDVELMSHDSKLVTRVYDKMLNKHMYIPFSSAHPLSVKRAFVKAERVRYKTICSLEQDYLACEKKLFLNLLRRGYPAKVLGEWFHDDLTVVDRPTPKLVLKSQYNPIWEYIRIGPIVDILTACQGDDVELDTLVTSLKRGRSMYDVYNLYNLTLLDALELEDEDRPDGSRAS